MVPSRATTVPALTLQSSHLNVCAGADPGFIVRSFCHGLLRPYCNEGAFQMKGIEGESEEKSKVVCRAGKTDSNG